MDNINLPLVDKLETITMMDLRRDVGFIATQVRLGKTYVVTKQGKPAMILLRPPGELAIHVDGKGNETFKLPS